MVTPALPPNPPSSEPDFLGTVGLLLRSARVRAKGRAAHQRQLRRKRAGGKATSNPGWLAVPIMLLVALFIHGAFAMALRGAVSAGRVVDLEAQGKMLSTWEMRSAFADLRKAREKKTDAAFLKMYEDSVDAAFHHAANGYPKRSDPEAYERKLREQYAQRGPAGFVPESAVTDLEGIGSSRVAPVACFIGLLMVGWWFVMVTFQGEGLEMDVQRRRHPMWEWLLSHPVRPGAVFLAEMITPLASNPNMIMAPVFWVVLLVMAGHGIGPAILAGTAMGVPLAVAASCLNKALEIGAMLRFSPRNRGAVLGLMSWFGFASFFGVVLMMNMQFQLERPVRWIAPLAHWINLPIFPWLTGYRDYHAHVLLAVGVAWAASLAVIALSVWLSARATERGLSGGFDGRVSTPGVLQAKRSHGGGWRGDALYRKELLWFWRDRGAVVQTILIPATIAGFQLINFRNALQASSGQWQYLCSLSVVFGTYFLFVLGPRSLLSEGPALWIALTWPRGLEDLLRAKARLWWILASLPFGIGAVLTLVLHPEAWWKVLLVSAGWWVFSRSLALKTITLVQAASTSGEPEPVPQGRRYAAWLGTFTFAAGIISQQWHIALIGVVYSWVTAAAMWQNFRARLPYLFDAWSEKFPEPPTVLQAMVSIFAMIEVIALTSAITVMLAGKEAVWMATALAYGGAGLITCAIVARWLSNRGIATREIWCWRSGPDTAVASTLPSVGGMALGIASGGALGLAGWGYVTAVKALFPALRPTVEQTAEYLSAHPDQRVWLFVLAVVCAPLAEEYLFRGLLFRALERDWGGWTAVFGSAAFFAIYHPPVSWIPVFALGTLNALLFRRTRNLWPAVAAHAIYNALLLLR